LDKSKKGNQKKKSEKKQKKRREEKLNTEFTPSKSKNAVGLLLPKIA
jgi:hypothetical protein